MGILKMVLFAIGIWLAIVVGGRLVFELLHRFAGMEADYQALITLVDLVGVIAGLGYFVIGLVRHRRT
jgi:hypothetical protein